MHTYTKHFDSILGMSAYMEKNWEYWEQGDKSGSSFTDCLSHDEARKVMSHGGYYEAGAKRLTKAHIDGAKFPMQRSPMPVPAPAMAGHRANVPAFLSGSPMGMVRNIDQPLGDKRCRILVAVAASAGVKHEALMNRGAAIMGCIEALQSEGYAVELTAGWFTKRLDYARVDLTLNVKSYQDTFNPAALAYILAEPSYLRKTLFSLCNILQEKHPESSALEGIRGGLGQPITDLEGLGYDIVFDGVHLSGEWTPKNSADKAMGKVHEWLAKHGEH